MLNRPIIRNYNNKNLQNVQKNRPRPQRVPAKQRHPSKPAMASSAILTLSNIPNTAAPEPVMALYLSLIHI